MDKKIIGIVIAVVLVLAVIIGVIAVVNNDALNTKENNEKLTTDSLENKEQNNAVKIDNTNSNISKEESKNADGKALVVYFSMAGEVYNVGTVDKGNTAIMASYISDYLKADTFEIVPVKAYTTVYNDLIKVAQDEQKANARPEFKNANSLDLSKYDTIFIGYPIWWGDLPPILYTFLEKYDFSGKTIIPFNTHEGSGASGTYNTIKNKMSTAKVNTNGLALQGKVSRQESSRSTVENWLKGLGY